MPAHQKLAMMIRGASTQSVASRVHLEDSPRRPAKIISSKEATRPDVAKTTISGPEPRGATGVSGAGRGKAQPGPLRLSLSLIDTVVKSKQAILSADAVTDSRFNASESIVDCRIRSVMCVPVIHAEGDVLGVIHVDSLGAVGGFTQEDLEVLAGVAGQAVTYLRWSLIGLPAMLAVMEVIEDQALLHNAATVGQHMAEGLRTLAKTHESLGPLRATGLFLGQDITRDGTPDGAEAARVVNALRDAGVLISATGPKGHTLKIRPPLILQKAQADLFLEKLDQALNP